MVALEVVRAKRKRKGRKEKKTLAPPFPCRVAGLFGSVARNGYGMNTCVPLV